jgi:hypothetical protein
MCSQFIPNRVNTYFLLFFLSLASTGAVRAQEKIDLGFRVGASVDNFLGANSWQASTSPWDYTGTNTAGFGFLFGAVSDFWVDSHLAISLQLLYHQQTATGDITQQPQGPENYYRAIGGVTTKTRLNYLELPLMLHARYGSSVFKANFSVGASVDYRLSESEEYSYEPIGFATQDAKYRFSLIAEPGVSYTFDDERTLYLNATFMDALSKFNPSGDYYAVFNKGMRLTAGMMWTVSH